MIKRLMLVLVFLSSSSLAQYKPKIVFTETTATYHEGMGKDSYRYTLVKSGGAYTFTHKSVRYALVFDLYTFISLNPYKGDGKMFIKTETLGVFQYPLYRLEATN